MDSKLQSMIEMYKLRFHTWDVENGRFWTRNQYFLTIISGLLVLYGSQSFTLILKFAVIIVGSSISFLWLNINRQSRFLEQYRRKTLRVYEDFIEKHLSNESEEEVIIAPPKIFSRKDFDDIKEPKLGYYRSIFILNIIFIGVWFYLIIYESIKFFSNA